MYSSITDSYFSELSHNQDIKSLDIILSTDIEEAELYTYFALSYVERMNIVDLTRNKLKDDDYFFNNSDDVFYLVILKVFVKLYNVLFSDFQQVKFEKEKLNIIESLHSEAVNACNSIKNKNKISAFVNDLDEFFTLVCKMYSEPSNTNIEIIRKQMVNLTERAYNFTRGKHLFRVFKSQKNNFIDRLNKFMEMLNKSSTIIILIDLSKLDILYENEVKALIEFKKQMKSKGIEIGIIVEGPNTRKIINIFDAIKPVEEFRLFRSELDAILGLLYS